MLFVVIIVLLSLLYNVYSFQSIISLPRMRRHNNMNMMLGGIAERMTGIVELLQGQQKVTEQNVDATLKEIKVILQLLLLLQNYHLCYQLIKKRLHY